MDLESFPQVSEEIQKLIDKNPTFRPKLLELKTVIQVTEDRRTERLEGKETKILALQYQLAVQEAVITTKSKEPVNTQSERNELITLLRKRNLELTRAKGRIGRLEREIVTLKSDKKESAKTKAKVKKPATAGNKQKSTKQKIQGPSCQKEVKSPKHSKSKTKVQKTKSKKKDQKTKLKGEFKKADVKGEVKNLTCRGRDMSPDS